MLYRLVSRSIVAGRGRFALALAAVAVPAAVVTATANFSLDAEKKMTRELRWRGPNVILEVRRGVRAMDAVEKSGAIRAMPGVLSISLERSDRIELSASGSYEEIEASLRKIGESSKTLQGRTIPVIAAEEGIVVSKLRGLLGMIAALILVSGGLAMAMSLATAVAERRLEIGLLLALGATGGRVVLFVAAQVAVVLGGGLALGLAAGLVLSDVMAWSVFGLPTDWRAGAIGISVAACAAMSALASIVPARRALAIEPAAVLKGE